MMGHQLTARPIPATTASSSIEFFAQRMVSATSTGPAENTDGSRYRQHCHPTAGQGARPNQ
ncbi:MAG: hypothetical protein IPG51_19135 [Chloroflexi bacterium]|nr:hypothetical protein [Chloroflexota bacterium]